MRRLCLAALAATAVLLGGAGVAGADIWSFTDSDGVVHFTNIRPSGKARGKWKRVMREGAPSGKAAGRRGACDRCDLVSAKDRSPDRFHRFDDLIYAASELYQIPPALIRAVIKVESDYDPRVVSSMGARGLMQLMPAVISDMGIDDAHDPQQNIFAGTRLLRLLANRYQGDIVRTIAAYHAGPGSLARYGDNVPPYERTRGYLRMVLDRYYQYKTAEARRAP